MTLVFLGSRPVDEVARIAEAGLVPLSALGAPSLRPLSVRGVPARRPRLLALDLEDERGRAGSVQAACAGALAAAALHEPERRAFWPHLTLARARHGLTTEPLDAVALPLEPFATSWVTLYRSVLRREGARYEPLERVALGP